MNDLGHKIDIKMQLCVHSFFHLFVTNATQVFAKIKEMGLY